MIKYLNILKTFIFEKSAKIYKFVFISIFLVGLFLPLQGMSKGFANFDQSFWGKQELTRALSNFRLWILNDTTFRQILVGSNKWLIYTAEYSMDDFQATFPFTDNELKTIQTNLDSFKTRLQSEGIELLVVVIPNKNTIYPEYMPAQIPKIGAQTRLDQVVDFQKNNGTTQILDLRQPLFEARNNHQIYYPSDTHWNPYGFYVGYAQIISQLGEAFPALKPHNWDDFNVISLGKRNGELGEALGQINVPEEYLDLQPKFDRNTIFRNFYLNNIKYLTAFNQQSTTSLSAIVYRDSFFTSLVPLIADHFRKSTYIWSFEVDEQYLQEEKPDVVIFECTERYLYTLLNLAVKN